MPNDNKLRGLWLHFDEVREVECELCLEYESAMMAGTVGANVPRDAIINAALYDPDNCPICSGTGVKRVRVWGMVEVARAMDESGMQPRCLLRPKWMQAAFETEEQVIRLTITAFLAKTLPGDVADNIEQEDV